jgi:hypothetical protein
MHVMGSLWRLRGLKRRDLEGMLCRIVSVKGKVAKVALVGDIIGRKYAVNLSRLVPPDDTGAGPTETDEQYVARALAEKKHERMQWVESFSTVRTDNIGLQGPLFFSNSELVKPRAAE